MSRRIPNALTYGLFVIGLAGALWQGSVIAALSGTALMLVLCLPLVVWMGLGMGDAKLFAALGCFCGPLLALELLLLSVLLGLVMGVAVVAVRKLRGPVSGDTAASLASLRLPFAIPIAAALPLTLAGVLPALLA